MKEETTVSYKILNQLRNGRTHDGRVGARVEPTGDNPQNQAWISVVMKKGADCRGTIIKDYFLSYEVEYVELDENFAENKYDNDWDYHLVRTETFYNIGNEVELEKILRKWLPDMGSLKPVANIEHPYF